MAGRPTAARDSSRPSSRPALRRALRGPLRRPLRRPLRQPRLVVSLASALVLLVMLAAWLRGLLGMLHSEAGRYDFSTYYAAARALRGDLHANIYSGAVLATVGTQAHVLVRPPLPYVYPPLLALLLAPATLLSFAVLSRLWLLLNAVLWLALIPLLAREIALPLAAPLSRRLGPLGSLAPSPVEGAHPRDRWRALGGDPALLMSLALAALLVLPAAPAIQTALTGQVNFLVLLPLALIPELGRRGHERAVGVMIGLAALLKLTPLLLVAYLLLRRRWRAAGAALGTVAALTLLCGLLVGPGTFLAGLGTMLGTGTSDAVLGHNEALFASLPGAHAGILAALFVVARLALALVGGWALYRLPHQDGRVGDAVGYGMALCLMLLLVPTAWVHHYVWVLPAAAVALGLALAALLARWGTVRAPRAAWLLGGVALACLALIWALPFGWDTTPAPVVTALAGLPLRPLLLELRALGTLGLLLALAGLGWGVVGRVRSTRVG